MKIFYDSKVAKAILFKGYSTIMLFGLVFTKRKNLEKETKNHKYTHVLQFYFLTILGLVVFMALLPVISFWWILLTPFTYYIFYFLEWLSRLLYFMGEENTPKIEHKPSKFPLRAVRRICGVLVCLISPNRLKTANDLAYKNISFEREAYLHKEDDGYNKSRKLWYHIKYYSKSKLI